jgi:hypothetical protein
MKEVIKTVLLGVVCLTTLATTAQVPVYSSYPSASAVLFLDFDGQTVNGTSWNIGGPIVCGPANLTNDQITEVFNRVAEDYRPFDINITTDSTKYFAAPANKRMRVILTITSAWYGSAGGVSFMNSFIWGDNTPCFVFTALLNYNVKYIAEAAAHEAGHTLGLRHQSSYDASCVKTNEYNYGNGTGEIAWAPIMGCGYYKNMSLWHNGQSSQGCNIYQSDLSVITSAVNGFSFRADDYASAFNSATLVPFVTGVFDINGVIEQNTDQDMFKFTMPFFSRFKLTATPYNVGTGDAGSNLDMQVTLYNSSQVAIGTYNPGTLMSSFIDTNLNAGNYYLKVEGKGNMYAPNYASLGSYSMEGEQILTPLPLQRLQLRGTFSQDKHILNWDIASDEPIIQQVLEISHDGKSFAQLVQPASSERSYTYRPVNTASALYRLSVTFSNGNHYYSNVVAIKTPTDNTRPKLLNSLVTNGPITISSPGSFAYYLIDLNGKIVGKGNLETGMNTINAYTLVNGMYIIRFTDGSDQWIEKLVKQ